MMLTRLYGEKEKSKSYQEFEFRWVHRFKYSPIRENGMEPQLPTGPIIAHNGKKKNVANIHDVNTRNKWIK